MSDDTHEVIKNPWPEWQPLPDGTHRRIFRFEFEARVPLDVELDAGLSEAGTLDVHVTRGDAPGALVVLATTRGNAWSDDIFFFAFYRLFLRLEEAFGRIRSIEGQERALWRPFRGTIRFGR